MRNLIYLLIMCFSFHTNAQNIKNFNLIIVIDDEIITNALGINFIIETPGGIQIFKSTEGYFPGNVSIKYSDFEKIISIETHKIYLQFNYQKYIGEKSYFYKYEIEYNKDWLQDYYNILRLYNLDKKKYRKKYNPLSKNKNYTFELESPSHTFQRLK